MHGQNHIKFEKTLLDTPLLSLPLFVSFVFEEKSFVLFLRLTAEQIYVFSL